MSRSQIQKKIDACLSESDEKSDGSGGAITGRGGVPALSLGVFEAHTKGHNQYEGFMEQGGLHF